MGARILLREAAKSVALTDTLELTSPLPSGEYFGGAFLVSACQKANGVDFVEIDARRSLPCQVMNPWPGKPVVVHEAGKSEATPFELNPTNGECIVFSATVDHKYRIEPRGLCAFLLSLGFQKAPPDPLPLIAECFGRLHQLTWDDTLLDETWIRLPRPSLFFGSGNGTRAIHEEDARMATRKPARRLG